MNITREWPRKLVSGTAVLALHVLLLIALAAALHHPADMISPAGRLVEVFLHPLPRAYTPPQPELIRPSRELTAPDIVAPQIDIAPEAPPAASLEGINRALFGCGADKLATMTADERAHCLQFTYVKPQDPALYLKPIDPNSPFAKVIAKRNAPFVPMEHACTPQESPQANLGLPCFSFPTGTVSGLLGGGQ
jgi:hypothetical protein